MSQQCNQNNELSVGLDFRLAKFKLLATPGIWSLNLFELEFSNSREKYSAYFCIVENNSLHIIYNHINPKLCAMYRWGYYSG